MLFGLQLYFLTVSAIIFLYAIKSKHKASKAFGYSLAVSIFPLLWLPYFSMEIARLAGIPLAYLPVISAGFALICVTGLRLSNKHLLLLMLSIVYIVYTFITTVLIGGVSIKNIAYWMAWPLNFLILFSAISFFSSISEKASQEVLRSTVVILVWGSLIGVLKYLIGLSGDSNFMPVVNRNGTVLFVVMIAPLLFYLFSSTIISKRFLFLSLFLVTACIIFTFSRSGIIGLVFGVLLYYMRLSFRDASKLIVLLSIGLMILFSGLADNVFGRLEGAYSTVGYVSEGGEMDSSMNDYKRVMLLKTTLAVIDQNFWFGTGLGLENYRNAINLLPGTHYDSKAHNFYLSYFAELGAVGFTIVALFFISIFRKLSPLSGKYRAFRVSFLVVALMMTMNEYILLPELWFFFGMLVGISEVSKRKLNND